MCTRLPLSKYRVHFPVIVGGTDPTGTHPWLQGPIEVKDGAAENCKPTMPPQADRLSRFLALIWAMRMGPSENSPSPAFRVNSRK
jgi:hypothetical protein